MALGEAERGRSARCIVESGEIPGYLFYYPWVIDRTADPDGVAAGQRLAASQTIEQSSSWIDKTEAEATRQAIRSEVRREVWRRDQGRCVRCGSRENLEYDHIIPVSKGGSNTARNIELLCETCNRSKSDSVQ